MNEFHTLILSFDFYIWQQNVWEEKQIELLNHMGSQHTKTQENGPLSLVSAGRIDAASSMVVLSACGLLQKKASSEGLPYY